jgi:site-specific recombinase XerD
VNCPHCGTPIPAGSRRDRRYCDRKCSALASYYRRKAGVPPPPPWQHPALQSDNPILRAAAEHARQLGQAHGWSRSTIRCAIDGLAAVLVGLPIGGRVRSSEVRARIPRAAPILRISEVLTDLGLLDDDTTPAIRSWIDHNADQLPAGFAEVIRDWLLVLLDGDRRAQPRSPNSLYAYFKFVRPVIEHWAAEHGHLREITTADIAAALEPLRGHQHRCTVVALRSLFRFAKKRGLIFANPTTRLKATRVEPGLIPLTDNEIRAVEQAARNPAQRLIVALAAVHAARTATIRHLTLDDLDLPNRRITLAGHNQRLGELTLRALRSWLKHRHATWPHSPNRHVLIATRTALATTPVSSVYVQDEMHSLGVNVDRIRGDRILHEALTVGPDPLHLSLVFNLSLSTASRYADMAQRLLDDELDQHAVEQDAAAVEDQLR